MKIYIKSALFIFLAVMANSCLTSDYLNDFVFGEVSGSNYPENYADGDRFEGVEENPFIKTADANLSTFSVDADGASYAIMRRYVTSGWELPKTAVRIEEYLNYFSFDYPQPEGNEQIALCHDIIECPWDNSHLLLRLGIKGKELKKEETPKANYVFLIDVSGSMSSDDKLKLFKKSLSSMLSELDPDDLISIVTYSGKVSKLLEATKVKEIDKIRKAINKLRAQGSTNGGDAMIMAYNEALANYIPGGNNRIIMGTDGDFNVGRIDDESIVEAVESYAKKGVYITVCGFGSGNLNDSMMKKVAISGNGNYFYIDSETEMAKVFINERSKFTAVANDTKVQISFDKETVNSYRLIGYERRIMNSEDFEDDSKDAGEIGAGQTITALYEIIPEAQATQKDEFSLGKFDCRYKKQLNSDSVQLPYLDLNYSKGARPSAETRFAAGVAAYGLTLINSKYKGSASLEMASTLVKEGLGFDPYGYRAELVTLIDKSKENL